MSAETTVPKNYHPVFVLRQYILRLLRANGAVAEKGPNAYGGLDPFVPLSEEPKLTQYDDPYIVYGYVLSGTNELPEAQTGALSMVIYSTDFGEITKVINIIVAALGRDDESARDVNEFSSAVTGVGEARPFVGIRFTNIRLNFVEGGSPEDTEGGRMSGLVNVGFDYVISYDDVVTSFAQWDGTKYVLNA